MDQSGEQEQLIITLARLNEERRVKVRVYTKRRLHSRAYIFNYGLVYDQRGRPMEREEKGIAILGSSNLTLHGLMHNTELNVLVQGNNNHADLVRWFDELWQESEGFD